jgi:hypothetical protein
MKANNPSKARLEAEAKLIMHTPFASSVLILRHYEGLDLRLVREWHATGCVRLTVLPALLSQGCQCQAVAEMLHAVPGAPPEVPLHDTM